MIKTSIRNYYLFVSVYISIFAFPLTCQSAESPEFDILVVPSLMESNMDGWFKIPVNSGPLIHKASSIYKGQFFNLLIFFSGYSADKENNLHLTYDVQIYGPDGKPTNDKGSDLLAYQGPMGNPKTLILNSHFLRIVFTEKYPLGIYNIKVIAHDKVSGKKFTSETPIELLPFTLPKPFKSQKEAGKWFMSYYRELSSVKAISAVQMLVKLDNKWINKNLNILSFFKNVFSDNLFLFKKIAENFNFFSKEDQMKFLLISSISNDSKLKTFANAGNEEDFQEIYKQGKEIKFPDINGEINSPIQLDILWSKFLTTGKYDPIKNIVNSLVLAKYKGTLDKIKSGEIEVTKELEQKAYLEATYRSALWSLISNSKQIPLVFKYCVFIYENEPLNEDIKQQLGAILNIVQKEMRENKEKNHSEP